MALANQSIDLKGFDRLKTLCEAESGAAADLVCVCPSVPSQSTVFYDISNSY